MSQASITQGQKAMLAIWRNKVKTGSVVLVKENTIAYQEGTILNVNFKENLAELNNPAALYYLPLTDSLYIQLICAKKQDSACKTCDKRTKNKEIRAGDANYNTWAKINIGDVILIGIAGEFFIGVAEDINLEERYAGLRTPGGVTYFPIDYPTSIANYNCK